MGDRKAVVLYSGGMDSTVLLWSLLPGAKALLCDYGQRHSKELARARAICGKYGIEHETAHLQGISHLLNKGSQSGREAVPDGHYAEESMKVTIVPNRNAIMLAVACGWAVSTGCRRVFFAAHAGDHAIYPDCRREFIDAFDKAMGLGNAWDPVEIVAPFADMTKAEIARRGFELGAPLEMTWSCYKGGELHCSKCGTCVERKEAFQLAGVEDPTVYAGA